MATKQRKKRQPDNNSVHGMFQKQFTVYVKIRCADVSPTDVSPTNFLILTSI